MIPAGVMAGGFDIFTTLVTQQTLVTISVSGGGVTKSATLTVSPIGAPPPPPPAVSLSTFTLSPTSVTGGNPSTGTVTLTSAAPAGGVVVSLSSQLPGSASVPPSVTVPAGATSASFTVTSFPVAATTVQIAATLGNVTLFAPLSVNVSAPPPPPPPPPGTLAAPALLAPASGARFSPGQTISFDWSDVSGAASYTIQVSTSSSFTTTKVNAAVTPSQFSTSSLPKADYFWRARANSSGGTAGTWSSVRSFRVN
jgi:hypothetical protein